MTSIPFKYSVQNILMRKITTFFTVLGLALVVFVFSSVLMLDAGLKETLVSTGENDNVIVTRRGAVTEIQSLISKEQASIIEQLEGVAYIPNPQASKETVVLINLPKKNGKKSNVVIRGTNNIGLSLRRDVSITSGRIFKDGSNEIIVGAAIAKRFRNLQLGNSVKFGGDNWRIVGHFVSGGNGFESEIWSNSENLMQSFKRQTYSSVIVRLVDKQKFLNISEAISADVRLPLQVKVEKLFYEDQSEALSNFITILGLTLTVIFSVGAIIGASITMQAAVTNRVSEIATLRALGFKRSAILIAFLVESLLLATLGGLLGLFLALCISNLEFSTTNFQTFSELAFKFSMDGEIALLSMLFALLMGILGGLIPAFHASTIKITEALRYC